jgi:hypothetical protein
MSLTILSWSGCGNLNTAPTPGLRVRSDSVSFRRVQGAVSNPLRGAFEISRPGDDQGVGFTEPESQRPLRPGRALAGERPTGEFGPR